MALCGEVTTSLPVVADVLKEILVQFSSERSIEWKKISICKRSRDLKDGEFVIPKGSTPKLTEENPTILLECVQLKLCCLNNVDLPCDRVDSDKYSLVRLHVNRPKAFANVIAQAEQRGQNYGYNMSPPKTTVVLNPADLCNKDEGCVITTAHLRQILIMRHVQELLLANGFQVHQIAVSSNFQMSETCKSLGFMESINTKEHPADKESIHNTVSSLQECKYREDLHSAGQIPGQSGDSKLEAVVVNLRQFIDETGVSTGKMGYDKNLSLVDVYNEDGPSDVTEHVSRLQNHILQLDKVNPHLHVVHIVSESRSYTQQQIDLLWRIVRRGSEVSQSHLVLGSVIGRAGQSCVQTAQEFIKLRFEQMKEASILKYGEDVHGEGWETTLSRMTSASIGFEILNTACRNSVKLDLSVDDHMGSEIRSGAFVMYNCARLATLFRHFEEAVARGVYPPLPSSGEVKFENLREEEEWELLFNYIYTFPDVVKQCVELHQSPLSDIHAKIHTHKISNFLINLSRSLSSYYSRIHILGDGKAHLLPVMFARLHLMKAVHQVLQNGLRLMGIQPLSQL